jgi:hydrogenase maturation protease
MKIIGVGNESRRDDGIGVLVARSLKQQSIPGVKVEVQEGDGASLMEAWKDESHVIVIDCAASGAPPGTVHHFFAQETKLDSHFFAGNTHTFGIAEAIELGRVLRELPQTLEVYAIEGEDFSPGTQIGSAVREAADQVIHNILSKNFSRSQ